MRWNRFEQVAEFRRDCGARRFAYNWAVTTISESFEAGKETGDYDSAVWSAYSLRKRWNQAKNDIAPWWAENSKESYAGGIADAVTGLKNWHDSKTGKRQGPKVKFPRRKKKTRDRLRCTYTTGALRADGSRMVVLPGVGQVRTAENTRPSVAACAPWDRPAAVGHHPGESRSLGGVATGGDHRTSPARPSYQHRRCRRRYREPPTDRHAPRRDRRGESHQPESVAGGAHGHSGAQTRH